MRKRLCGRSGETALQEETGCRYGLMIDSATVAAEEVQGVEGPQRPEPQTFCGSLLRDTHWKCLTLSLIIWVCLAFVIWCQCGKRNSVSTADYFRHSVPYDSATPPCENGYVYIPVAFAIMFYVIYLVECWNCHTRLELVNRIDTQMVYEYVKRIQEALPFVWWEVICYHYVRRTRQVTRYRNGDAFTSTQVYYERVNSYTTGSAFNFAAAGCQDVSRRLTGLEDFPATKIRFSKGFSFDNENAKADFEGQRNDFFQENESRDEYMECREGMDFLNIRPPEYVVAISGCNSRSEPWYLSHSTFLVGSLLLFSWPIRVLIEYRTSFLHYHVHKVFGHNFSDSQPYTVTGSLGNTLVGAHRRPVSIASADLEYFISTNLQQLPSYSEALLMPLPEQERCRNAAGFNSALASINSLFRSSSTGGGWIWRAGRHRGSQPSIEFEDASMTSRTSRWFKGMRSDLRRNTSDSYIVRHCLHQPPPVSASRNTILEESATAEEAEIDQQTTLDQGLPNYEAALFLPKISVGTSRKHMAHTSSDVSGHQRSINRHFRTLNRSRSLAMLSHVLTRSLRCFSRSRSDYQCVLDTNSNGLTTPSHMHSASPSGLPLGHLTTIDNYLTDTATSSPTDAERDNHSHLPVNQTSSVTYLAQEERTLFNMDNKNTDQLPPFV